MSFDSEDFILIEWSINKIFTVIQNHKNVKLNDTVTCRVNDIKDIGNVVFVGTEEKCNQILNNFNLKKVKLKKLKNCLSRETNLNLPEDNFLRRSSLSSISALEENSNKFGQKYASAIFSYLSNKNENCTRNCCSKFDDLDKPKSLSLDESIEQTCSNCIKLKNEINQLKNKILKFEKLIKFSPMVLNWFNELQNLTEINSIDLSNLSLNEIKDKTNYVPEIKIDDLC